MHHGVLDLCACGFFLTWSKIYSTNVAMYSKASHSHCFIFLLQFKVLDGYFLGLIFRLRTFLIFFFQFYLQLFALFFQFNNVINFFLVEVFNLIFQFSYFLFCFSSFELMMPFSKSFSFFFKFLQLLFQADLSLWSCHQSLFSSVGYFISLF